MSRAFVKERDGEIEALPDRPVSQHANFVSAEGYAQIESEVARLQAEYARAQSAEDRNALAHIGRDLRYWQQRRATAELVPPPEDTETVRFGSAVTIERSDGRRQTWHIVGEDEADPTRGTLSYVSPVARALTGKSIGDVIKVGNFEAEIVAIA